MRISLVTKLTAPTIACVLVILLGVMILSYRQSVDETLARSEHQLQSQAALVLDALESNYSKAAALAALVAAMPAAQEALAAGDRKALLGLYLKAFDQVKTAHGLAQFQFHLPPATSFVRIHKPAKFGDDLSGFRKTVVQTNSDHQPVRGLEVGVAGAGFRAVYPVSHQGRHLGTVEFGLKLNDKFALALKKRHDFDFAVVAPASGGDGFRFWAHTSQGLKLPPAGHPAIGKVLKGGGTIIREEEHGDATKLVYYGPLPDYSGKPAAVLIIATDLTAAMDQARNHVWLLTLGGLVALILVSGVMFWSSSRVVRGIKKINQSLNQTSSQVTDLSHTMAQSSRDLADGASQQAASLEETAASQEEIASMVKANSANADEADRFMGETKRIMISSARSLQEMTRSMEDINQASNQIAGIIKSIDEIAFQTNLLALNAAVEAARAGEAGAGFAVVADEVRSLAMRAAEAARQTQEMIDSTVTKIKSGTEIVTATNQEFAEVEKSGNQVGELVAAIAAASTDQSQGISQINSALSQIEGVTRQVAAGAQEGAEVSAQLDEHAALIGELSQRLDDLIRGS